MSLSTRTQRWLIAGALTLSAVALGHQAVGRTAPHRSAPVPAAQPPALASLALGYKPEAEPRIEMAQARARSAQTAESFAWLAAAMLKRKRETSDAAYYQYAVDALDAARSVDDDDLTVLTVRIMIDQDAHRFASARDLSRKLIAARGDDPSGHLMLGDALLELGDYEGTIEAYEAAGDMRPDLRSYNRAAYVRWLHGDFTGSLELVELAIDAGSPRDPESMAWCFVDLANMYLERGDHVRAKRASKRADALVPGYAPALIALARAHAIAGESQAAIRVLEASTQRLPHVAELVLLSELYASEANPSAAATTRARAEALAHTDPRPMALFYARHQMHPQKAFALAEQELAARRNVEAFATLALAALRADKLDMAEEAAEESLKLGTPKASYLLHRGLIRARRGDRDAAHADLAAALTLNPLADPLLVRELRTATR